MVFACFWRSKTSPSSRLCPQWPHFLAAGGLVQEQSKHWKSWFCSTQRPKNNDFTQPNTQVQCGKKCGLFRSWSFVIPHDFGFCSLFETCRLSRAIWSVQPWHDRPYSIHQADGETFSLTCCQSGAGFKWWVSRGKYWRHPIDPSSMRHNHNIVNTRPRPIPPVLLNQLAFFWCSFAQTNRHLRARECNGPTSGSRPWMVTRT